MVELMKTLAVGVAGALVAAVPFWIEYGLKPWPTWWLGYWVGFLGAGWAMFWRRVWAGG